MDYLSEFDSLLGAVVLFTKAVALEVAKQNIRVNAVCPGDTFVKRWIERDGPKV
jgi:NAD(P)-dependent dehydrogenase (short-subunit alcohol dehydrogenase family)